jgi:hypothetical protein
MDNNLEKFMELMDMIKILSSISNHNEHPPKQTPESSYNGELHIYDYELTNNLEALLGALPYIEIKYQSLVLTFIKILELKILLENYKDKNKSFYNVKNKNWKIELLKSISPKLTGEKKYKVELLLKYSEICELLSNISVFKSDKTYS